MDKPFVEREKELLLMNRALNHKCKELCYTTKKTIKTKLHVQKKSKQTEQQNSTTITRKIDKKPPIQSYIGTRLALIENLEELNDDSLNSNEKLPNEIMKKVPPSLTSEIEIQKTTKGLLKNEYSQEIGKKNISTEGLIK